MDVLVMRLESYDDRSTTPKEERPYDNQKRNRPKQRQPRRNYSPDLRRTKRVGLRPSNFGLDQQLHSILHRYVSCLPDRHPPGGIEWLSFVRQSERLCLSSSWPSWPRRAVGTARCRRSDPHPHLPERRSAASSEGAP